MTSQVLWAESRQASWNGLHLRLFCWDTLEETRRCLDFPSWHIPLSHSTVLPRETPHNCTLLPDSSFFGEDSSCLKPGWPPPWLLSSWHFWCLPLAAPHGYAHGSMQSYKKNLNLNVKKLLFITGGISPPPFVTWSRAVTLLISNK